MSKKENMTELKPKVNTFQKAMLKNCEKGNIYAGKRFLGTVKLDTLSFFFIISSVKFSY